MRVEHCPLKAGPEGKRCLPFFLFCFVVGGLGGGFDGPGGGFLFDVVSVVALLPLLLYHLSPDLHPLDYLFWAEVNRRLRRQESRFAKTKRKVLL